MPSGPKKRLRAKRKKQGSPATDANSDRETEVLSVTGSMDVDDLESGLDTPSKASSRPAFLDREAVSSQTDEWVRVSDFDVGTPTSQIEENDPSAEYGDIGSSRRSLDKLAEWETVTGEHIPFRQEGSINSPEEEPSECEAASAHSSESYTNVPSPHLALGDKDGDSIDSDRKNRMANRSSCSSSSAGSIEAKRAPAFAENLDVSPSTDIGEAVSSACPLPSVSAAGEGQVEDSERFNEDSVEEEVHGNHSVTATKVLSDEAKMNFDGTRVPTQETTTQAPDTDDQDKVVGTSELCGPGSMEGKSLEESRKHGKEETDPASMESTLAATKPDEQEIISANGTDITELDALLNTTALAEETPGEQKSLPIVNESSGEENAVVASLADVQDKNLKVDEKFASSTCDESPAADETEVASTSADAEEKTKRDAPDSEVATFVEKNPFDSQDLIADSFSVKVAPTSGTAQPVALSEGRHLSVSTSLEKNGVSVLSRAKMLAENPVVPAILQLLEGLGFT